MSPTIITPFLKLLPGAGTRIYLNGALLTVREAESLLERVYGTDFTARTYDVTSVLDEYNVAVIVSIETSEATQLGLLAEVKAKNSSEI